MAQPTFNPVEIISPDECIEFTLNRNEPAGNATATWGPRCFEEIMFSTAAKVTIARKMFEFEYFHHGVGKERSKAIARWENWLKGVGLLGDRADVGPEVQEEVRKALQSHVSRLSLEFSKQGAWWLGEQEGPTTRKKGKLTKEKLDESLYVSTAAKWESQQPGWDGHIKTRNVSWTVYYFREGTERCIDDNFFTAAFLREAIEKAIEAWGFQRSEFFDEEEDTN